MLGEGKGVIEAPNMLDFLCGKQFTHFQTDRSEDEDVGRGIWHRTRDVMSLNQVIESSH